MHRLLTFRLRHGRASSGCLGERGQDLVEYALVFPLVLTLMLGIVEFGRVIFTYDTLANAAREGARYASVASAYTDPAPLSTGVHDRALQLTAGIVCSPDPRPAVTYTVENGQAQVTVVCPVSLIIGDIFGSTGRPTITVRAVATMNFE